MHQCSLGLIALATCLITCLCGGSLLSSPCYDFVFGVSTGHVGTTSFSDPALYRDENNSVKFLFESNYVRTSIWANWTYEDEYDYVAKTVVPFLIAEKGNKATLVDLGHTNLYYLDALVEYLTYQTNFSVLFLRITRRKFESAVSLTFKTSNNASLPAEGHKDMCSSWVRYCPHQRTEDVILKMHRGTWKRFSVFQQALWLIDEVEERWKQILRRHPNINREQIYWTKVKMKSFDIAASKIAQLLKLAPAGDNKMMNVTRNQTKTHANSLTNKTNLELRNKYYLSEASRYRSLASIRKMQVNISTSKVRRLEGNPILAATPNESLSGASLIRVPFWIPNPIGKYYLYYSSHNAPSIYIATSNSINGPWKTKENSEMKRKTVLSLASVSPPCSSHVASPDVIIDEKSQRIRMYFHCSVASKKQHTFVAMSDDGLSFSIVSKKSLGIFYFRVFRFDDMWYSMAKGGVLYRSKNGLSDFEEGYNPLQNSHNRSTSSEYNTPGPRHVAVIVTNSVDFQGMTKSNLSVYYSNIGDSPECIYRCIIELSRDWASWKVVMPPEEILRPSRPWEGSQLPKTVSKPGASMQPENAVRSPAIFQNPMNYRHYLLYSVAGEQGIAIAEIYQK